MNSTEELPPQVPALPHWPETLEPVDTTAAAFLVIAVGALESTAAVADRWVGQAEAVAPTRLLCLDSMSSDDDCIALRTALEDSRTGVRILITGGQYDVIRALTVAREAGAIPAELTSFVVHVDDAPIYCAHCRGTFRAHAGPGDEIECPGCARTIEVHSHFASALGSFLASDARAREL